MTTKTGKAFYLAAGPLFLILFIDGMGLGLVFPVLNALIINPSQSFLSPATTHIMRNFIFGSIISIFMFCWFFGAAFLGDLSDIIGRKKSLMICLLGASLGYVLSLLGTLFSSVGLLIFGRVIAGFTSGSQSIAQAAIVDISTSEKKSQHIGLILLSSSLGFIVGPLIGGFLSDKEIVSWFSFSTPFCFAAIMSLLNAALLHLLFHETFVQTKKMTIQWHHAIRIFTSAFTNKHVKELSVIFLIMMFGWSSFYSFISMFLYTRYDFSPLRISAFMALMGLGFGIGTGVIINYCTAHFTLKKIIVVSLLLTALAGFIIVITHHAIYAWSLVTPLVAALAVAYSAIITLFSNQVDADSQGWIMGITGAIMAFAFGITGLLVSTIADLNPDMPLIISAVSLTISALLLAVWYRK